MAAPLVLGLVPDLMFGTQIEGVLERLGYRVELVRDASALADRVGEAGLALVLVDLAARGVDVPAAIRALKGDAGTAEVPVVAFGPHLDEAAREAARAAGADAVVANSKLAFDLPGLVARYARGLEA
jgi:CheY-like chemotaxis protein